MILVVQEGSICMQGFVFLFLKGVFMTDKLEKDDEITMNQN